MNPFLRLLRFSRPYRWRLVAAFAWMILYALGAAGLARLIQNVFDEVLRNGQHLLLVAVGMMAAGLAKGLGGYFSAYLMSDVGHRGSGREFSRAVSQQRHLSPASGAHHG